MVTIEDLMVRYPNGVTALKKTTLSVAPGSFTVLLGPSGAGKSSLLRSLNGLVRPTSGDVRKSDGGSIFASTATLRSHRRETGMVFQQHHLIGRLSALSNVLMGRLSRYPGWRALAPLPRRDREAALGCLDRVGLLEKALVRADNLSGGQQQRVGVARAMVQEPSLILADEPVASLDPAAADRVLGDLKRICAEDGITAIVSLHQVDYARRYADEIVALSAGEIVFRGDASALGDEALHRIYGRTGAALAPAAA